MGKTGYFFGGVLLFYIIFLLISVAMYPQMNVQEKQNDTVKIIYYVKPADYDVRKDVVKDFIMYVSIATALLIIIGYILLEGLDN